MPDIWSVWSVGASAAALALRGQGFSPREADRLVTLRQRYERGEFREVTDSQKRLEFARWLVQHGKLTDYMETAETDASGAPAGLPGAPAATVAESPTGERGSAATNAGERSAA